MSSPEITEHCGVEIRYGYDIHTDTWVAHINVPQSRRAGGFQSQVRQNMRRALPPAGEKYSVHGDRAEDVIDAMKDAIDEYLDA